MSGEDMSLRFNGLKKYPDKIEKLSKIDQQYFPFPRHALDLNLSNKDLSILLAICYHTNFFEGKKAVVFEESVDRLTVSLKKSSAKKSDFVESINNLRRAKVIKIDGKVDDVFDVAVNMPNGYATVTYGEFKRLSKVSSRKSWIVYAVFLVINCSLFITDKKLSSHVFYRPQNYISGKLAISDRTSSRAISELEEVGVFAVYHVRLIDSIKQKSVISRYIHRDKLHLWMDKELQKPYSAVYKIIDETGEE